jgi:hypothetical protein
VSEDPGKSGMDLAINTFVDKIKEIHPELNQEEFHNVVNEYVQEYVQEADEEEESGERS